MSLEKIGKEKILEFLFLILFVFSISIFDRF
jgi:hypothetical protein